MPVPERLHVIRTDGGHCGTFEWGTALELAGEGGCYAMDAEGQRTVSRDGLWRREPMPPSVIQQCPRTRIRES